jgi:hypothetical protein
MTQIVDGELAEEDPTQSRRRRAARRLSNSRQTWALRADLAEPEHPLDQILDGAPVTTGDREARREATQAGADDRGHATVRRLPEDPGVVPRELGGLGLRHPLRVRWLPVLVAMPETPDR